MKKNSYDFIRSRSMSHKHTIMHKVIEICIELSPFWPQNWQFMRYTGEIGSAISYFRTTIKTVICIERWYMLAWWSTSDVKFDKN